MFGGGESTQIQLHCLVYSLLQYSALLFLLEYHNQEVQDKLKQLSIRSGYDVDLVCLDILVSNIHLLSHTRQFCTLANREGPQTRMCAYTFSCDHVDDGPCIRPKVLCYRFELRRLRTDLDVLECVQIKS